MIKCTTMDEKIPSLNIAICVQIHYQLSCVGFDELKGIKCILATQELKSAVVVKGSG